MTGPHVPVLASVSGAAPAGEAQLEAVYEDGGEDTGQQSTQQHPRITDTRLQVALSSGLRPHNTSTDSTQMSYITSCYATHVISGGGVIIFVINIV